MELLNKLHKVKFVLCISVLLVYKLLTALYNLWSLRTYEFNFRSFVCASERYEKIICKGCSSFHNKILYKAFYDCKNLVSIFLSTLAIYKSDKIFYYFVRSGDIYNQKGDSHYLDFVLSLV